VEHVRGGDEKTDERSNSTRGSGRRGVVLLRVQDLEEGGRGVARKSMDILSTSSRRKTGLREPAFFIIWMIWPGKAPM